MGFAVFFGAEAEARDLARPSTKEYSQILLGSFILPTLNSLPAAIAAITGQ